MKAMLEIEEQHFRS